VLAYLLFVLPAALTTSGPGYFGGSLVLVAVLAVPVLLLLGMAIRTAVRMAIAVRGLEAGARRVESGDFTARVEERGPGDTRAVARAFNAMTARLEAEDTRRRSAMADVAHELRTPLSIIRGEAEGILDGLYAGDPEHLGNIIESTRTLERLVDDLRTLALSEVGSLELVREPVDIAVLLDDVCEAHRSQADAVGVVLTATTEGDVPALEADPVRLRSILANLVTNAIRHTPAAGSVALSARRDGDHVTITVSDTGAGIPAELLPRVTERFVKGPGSDGSGLGLAIANDLVAAHGGTLAVESEPGHGTNVQVTLPLRHP
jgi:two-component system sensor histidine kinase BaeS